MTITFLEETNNLIYTVDFDKYTTKKRENLSVLKRILACSQRSLQLISLFFISFKNAAWSTLISSPSSFYYYVFDGGNGSGSERISMLIFRILTWVAAMGWGLSATTLCLFIEKASSGHATLLKEFANDRINTEHLKNRRIRAQRKHCTRKYYSQ